MTAEIIANAFKLFVLTVSYAIDLAKKRDAAIADAKARRALFETAVAKALERMAADTVAEKRAVDAVDSKIDEESTKPRQ